MLRFSFKKFLVEREKIAGYVSTLDTDLDIDPKSFKDQVFSASNITIANIIYTGIVYKIIHMDRGPGGKPTKGIIQITQIMGKTFRKDQDGKYVILPNNPPQGPIVLMGSELENLLTQGMNQPPVQPGGMPPPTTPGGPMGM